MTGVGLEILTRIVGYALIPGNFQAVSPNLPVRVGIFAEANTDMQDDLDVDTPVQITSVAQAAKIGGWGSPIYQIAKILFPRSGNGLGGIPCLVYPQAEADGASAKVMQIAVVGTATKSGTHYIVISGRKSVEGQAYAVNIEAGDDAAAIHDKISDVIMNVSGSPMKATSTDYYAELTSKWKGLTANGIAVSMDTNGDDLGLTYATSTITAGAATPDIADSLALIGNDWVTHLVNGYGLVTTTMDSLEAFVGHPDADNPTGRYVGTTFKPLLAFSGSVLEDPSSITDTRKNECTIEVASAPKSDGLAMEAAANWCLLRALCAQNTPHLDIAGKALPDMPTPSDIGLMADWKERDRIMKKGCSTVDQIGGQYVVQDPITTYHPEGESSPQFRYGRDLIIDWNIRFGYKIREELNVVDHTLVNDGDSVSATKIVKPKMWKAELAAYADDLTSRALIVDPAFMTSSVRASISPTNASRFSTFFRYKRSSIVRVSDTTAEAGQNFGSLSAN